MNATSIVLFIFLIYAAQLGVAATPHKAKKAMVVSAHPQATHIGVSILQRGGNAVDAAVAVQFALAVCYPNAGNIGGGGFLVWRSNKGAIATIDFREQAPFKAHKDMFLDAQGNPIKELSLAGEKASGVPGSVAGMAEAHKRYGSLAWRKLLQPAVQLASQGFPLTAKQASELNEFMPKFAKWNDSTCPLLRSTPWKKGDTLRQPELAQTLLRIANKGSDGFYKGETARLLVEQMKRGNGIITLDDLSMYKARWRTPLVGRYKDYSIISMPPPSSGGVALLQLLQMFEQQAPTPMQFHSTETVHCMVEAERRVYADRAEYLGDPDYVSVPVSTLVSPEYCAKRMSTFSADSATPSTQVRAGEISQRESEQTTHFSIVDAKGNAVSLTTTLNDSYGSKVMVRGAGFLLNNEMDDFSVKPGAPNMYGLLGTTANAIAPRKRMVSSMTPTIVEKQGKLFMVVGTPGGGTIITSVFQTILNVVEFGMNIQDAVAAKRFHHQWYPDHIFIEDGSFTQQQQTELQKKGHRFKQRDPIGRIDAIVIGKDGYLYGGADPRGDDTAQGY